MNSTSSASSATTFNTSKKHITKFEQVEWVHRRLLYDLMSSVYEFILISNSTGNAESRNVNATGTDYRLSPNAESQLMHVHLCLEQIFLSGLRIYKPDKSADLWRFIEALNWINPHMTVSIGSPVSNNDSAIRITPPKNPRIRNDKALNWIYENLLTHQLESKLKCLLSDNEHLMNCYEVTIAFFFSKKFVEALYTCLDAFNRRQYNSLLQIDEKLYISVIDETIKSSAGASYRLRYENMNLESKEKKNVIKDNFMTVNSNSNSNSFCDDNFKLKATTTTTTTAPNRRNRKQSGRHRCKLKHSVSLKIRPWASLPEIRGNIKPVTRHLARSESQPIRSKSNRIKLTVENLAIKDRQKVPSIQLKKRKSEINSSSNHSNLIDNAINDLQPINLVKCDDIKIHTDRRCGRSTDLSLNAPTFTSGEPSQDSTKNENVPCLLSNPTNNNLLPFLNAANSTTYKLDEFSSPGKKSTPNSAPADFALFFAANGSKIENRYKSSPFLGNVESNSASVSPLCNHNECMPAVPNRAQSLTSYLQEAQRIRWNITDLERENAHLILSDAIISAIEEIKCSQMERKKEQNDKLAGTKKRKQHHKPRILKNWMIGDDGDAESDKVPSNLTDDESSSFLSEVTPISQSSSDSELSYVSSDSDSTTASNAGDLKRLKVFTVSSHSINDHSAFAEWAENSNETLSAEGIALSLISKFKDYQLPRAADVLYSHAEQLDELNRALDFGSDEMNRVPYTRGTPDWAPPRFQIIFTRHPIPDRRSLLEQQKYRCAGCGMHIQAAFVNSLRYCEYSGKYHCTGCHRNQISAIPARVLDRWDFSCHPVSVFSYRLLDQIWKVPLFRVPDLSQDLYDKVRSLRYCRMRRLQLKYVHDFLQTCRFAHDDKAKTEFDSLPSHIYDDIDNWSMYDFVNVRNGTFLKAINDIIPKGEQHVFNCELCTANGFICEYCGDNSVIFPWQAKVIRCAKCGSCSHITCSKDQCHKCQRLEKLKKN